MNPRFLKPDPSLLDSLRSTFPENFDAVLSRAAYCWDVYGLPDGTRNPTRGAGVHITTTPTEDSINRAFNNVLSDLLHDEDRWLLSIPRAIAPLPSLEARIRLSRDGGAALIMPLGLFGGLFYFNELWYVYELDRRRDAAILDREPDDNLIKVIAHWLLNVPIEGAALETEKQLSLLLVARRKTWSEGDRYFIWATTVVQQIFFLLHELGHVVSADENFEKLDDYDASSWSFFYQFMEEQWADQWATKRLARGIKGVFQKDPLMSVQALLSLFGITALLQEYGYLKTDIDRTELGPRCAFIINGIAPGTLPAAGDFGVRTIFDAFDRLNRLLTGSRTSSYKKPYHWRTVRLPPEGD